MIVLNVEHFWLAFLACYHFVVVAVAAIRAYECVCAMMTDVYNFCHNLSLCSNRACPMCAHACASCDPNYLRIVCHNLRIHI